MRGLVAFLTLSTSLVASQSTGAGLNRLAKQQGKLYFGSATDNSELTDAPYVAILTNSHEFGQHTPANSMKWDATEPEQDVFNFTGGDQILRLAQSHGAIVRGHNLVWHSQLPNWLTTTNFTKSELIDVMKNHVRNLVGHFKGQLYAWDVVNEPLNEDGTLETSNNPFAQIIGEDYIGIALDTAHEVDPHVKLYINDFNIEGVGAKSTGMQNLVKSLKAKGHPIHGIGFESHFILNELPPNITENMKAFVDLGVEVAITELDIRMNLPSNATLLQQQQQNYQSVIESCMAVEKCVGMTLWDFTDKFSWIPGTFAGQGAACPWDENLILKPAYQGIVNGILSKKH